MILRVIGTLLLFALLWVVAAIYSNLVTLQSHVDDAWQDIVRLLERRKALVPDLMVIMKNLSAADWEAVEAVAFAHAIAVAAESPREKFQSDAELAQALENLFKTAGTRPEIASNQKYVQIATIYRDTNEKLSAALEEYDLHVLKYNNGIQTFPGNICASVFQFKERSGLDALLSE